MALRVVLRILGMLVMCAGGYLLFCGACALAGADWACPCADTVAFCVSGEMVIVAGGIVFLVGMGLLAWHPGGTRR